MPRPVPSGSRWSRITRSQSLSASALRAVATVSAVSTVAPSSSSLCFRLLRSASSSSTTRSLRRFSLDALAMLEPRGRQHREEDPDFREDSPAFPSFPSEGAPQGGSARGSIATRGPSSLPRAASAPSRRFVEIARSKRPVAVALLVGVDLVAEMPSRARALLAAEEERLPVPRALDRHLRVDGLPALVAMGLHRRSPFESSGFRTLEQIHAPPSFIASRRPRARCVRAPSGPRRGSLLRLREA